MISDGNFGFGDPLNPHQDLTFDLTFTERRRGVEMKMIVGDVIPENALDFV